MACCCRFHPSDSPSLLSAARTRVCVETCRSYFTIWSIVHTDACRVDADRKVYCIYSITMCTIWSWLWFHVGGPSGDISLGAVSHFDDTKTIQVLYNTVERVKALVYNLTEEEEEKPCQAVKKKKESALRDKPGRRPRCQVRLLRDRTTITKTTSTRR